MKTFALFIFALIAFSLVNAQKNIDLSMKISDGKLLKNDADIYTLPTIKILGLKTEAEFIHLEKTILANTNVAKFQYLDNPETDGARKALLSFKVKDEKIIVDLFKSINVNNIYINDKTFSVNQIEEIKAYVRELKEKKNTERSAIAKKRIPDSNE